MKFQGQLSEMLIKVFDGIEKAAKNGNSSEVARLSGIARQIEQDRLSCQNISGRYALKYGIDSTISIGTDNSTELPSTKGSALKKSNSNEGTNEKSKMAQGRSDGREARKHLCDELKKRGLNIGSSTRTTTQKGVVLTAFANEQRTDRWFLGVKEGTRLSHCPFHAVICLCKTSMGETIRFVLLDSFLQKYWSTMSRSHGDVKLTIVRDDDEFYLLVPPGNRINLNSYRDNFDSL